MVAAFPRPILSEATRSMGVSTKLHSRAFSSGGTPVLYTPPIRAQDPYRYGRPMHSTLKPLFGFVAILLLVLACSESYAEPSPVGIWDVVGRDDSGTALKATLFLEPPDKDDYSPTWFKGHFDWDGSNKTGGREYVVLATYDYQARQSQLRGAEREGAAGSIRSTIYKASMSEAADRLKDGA